jgi:RimJ/RimL family protein N-acetyltransferase
VVELPSGDLVGTVGINVPDWLPEVMPAHDVGWTVVQEHQRRGYATEAARAVLDWYFVTAAVGDRVIGIHNSGNPRSGEVMDRLGMRWIAHLPHPDLGYGLEIRELTLTDWLSS